VRLERDALAKLDAVATTAGSRSDAVKLLLSKVEVTYEPRTVTLQVPVIKVAGGKAEAASPQRLQGHRPK
jgi:hypothetical protein